MRTPIPKGSEDPFWWCSFCDTYRYVQKETDSLVHKRQQNGTPSFVPLGAAARGGTLPPPPHLLSSLAGPTSNAPLPVSPRHASSTAGAALAFHFLCNTIPVLRSPELPREEDRFQLWKFDFLKNIHYRYMNRHISVREETHGIRCSLYRKGFIAFLCPGSSISCITVLLTDNWTMNLRKR